MGNKEQNLLRKIANAIVANASSICQGKLTLSMYLFRYSEFLNSPTYECIASKYLKDSFMDMEKAINGRSYNSLAEMGIGLIRLIKAGYVEDSNHSEILCRIDNLVFENQINILKDDITWRLLYLLYRLKYYPNNFEMKYYEHFMSMCVVDENHALLLLSKEPTGHCVLLYLYIILQYQKHLGDFSGIIEELINAINYYRGYFQPMAKYCLIKSCEIIPSKEKAYNEINDLIKNIKTVSSEAGYYNDAYIMDILDCTSSFLISKGTADLVEKIRDLYYDMQLGPQRLASIGIMMLSNQ